MVKTDKKTVAAGFSLRGKDAPMKGAATGDAVLLGTFNGF
jgi:hypothetical protein